MLEVELTVKNFFSMLFQADDYVYVGSITQGKWVLAGEIHKYQLVPEFFCINATLDGDRKKDSITSHVNFLFEMDGDLSPDEQLAIVHKSGVTPASVVWSGNKSYHFIVSLQEPLDLTYPDVSSAYAAHWQFLADKIDKAAGRRVCDPACKNPNRLSRFPDAMRDNGNRQNLVNLGILTPPLGLSLEGKQRRLGARIDTASSMDLEDFERRFSHLRSVRQLKNMKYIVQPYNMYFIIFRSTIWVAEETGIPEHTMRAFYNKHLTPAFAKVGYDIEKLPDYIGRVYDRVRQNQKSK